MRLIGAGEVPFWLLDPTIAERPVEFHASPSTAPPALAIAVQMARVLAGLWIGEPVPAGVVPRSSAAST